MRSKVKLYFLIIKSFFLSITLTRKKQKNVAILVSKKWKNKVSDDLLIKNELLRNHINASLVTWEDNHNYAKYDLIFVRSIWGYEENIKEFESFLNKISKEKVQIVNSITLMKNNYDKEYQFKLLDKYQIPHIKTTFIQKKCPNIEDFIKNEVKDKEIVIKPTISASGNNTYLISEDKKRNNVISLSEVNKKYININKEKSLMVQPFIKEIDNGEISLIYINGTFTHSVIRYPNIFNNKSSVKYLEQSKLDTKIFDVASKVLEIKENKNALYERIDMVKIDDEYFVMEVELVEPDLFIRNIKEVQLKDYILKKIVLAIKNRL
ncbi:MAG: RimK family alpha-L-glutamate ligase [Bacilli bacterium]